MVVGGGGFIGFRVVAKLVEERKKVVCFDLFPDLTKFEDYEQQVRISRGNITCIEELISAIVENQVTEIVNVAYTVASETEIFPQAALRVNILGTNNVFEAARLCRVPRVILASSIVVYGGQSQFGDRLVSEDDFGRPTILSGVMKQLNEFMGQHYMNKYGINVTIVRLSHVFGHGRKVDGVGAYFGSLISNPAIGKEVNIDIRPDSKFSVIYIEDVADLFVEILKKNRTPSFVYNSGGHMCTLKQLADIVEKFIPDAKINFGAKVFASVVNQIDDRRVRGELGFKKNILENGVLNHISEARKACNLIPKDR